MLTFRLLAIVLVIVNTWLLYPVHSDPIRRYKRTLTWRAEQKRASLTGEKCWQDSGVRRRRHAPQHHPLGAFPRIQDGTARFYYHRAFLSDLRWYQIENNSFYELKKSVETGAGSTDHTRNSQTNVTKSNWAPSEGFERVARKRRSLPAAVNNKSRTVLTAKPTSTSTLKLRKRHGGNSWTYRSHKSRRSVEERVTENEEEKVRLNHQRLTKPRSTDYNGESDDYSEEHQVALDPNGDMWEVETNSESPQTMKAMYFTGKKEQLTVHPKAALELPRLEFSLELWVKPEGGQNNPAIIAGVFDNCSHSLSDKGWSVGIQTVDPTGRNDARYFFTVRTDRALKATTVFGHQRYRANAWTHLVVSYNGQRMVLYIDGAKEGESDEQSGALYSSFMGTCRTLILGGDQSDRPHNFRGNLGTVLLHRSSHGFHKLPINLSHKGPYFTFKGDFSKVEEQWTTYKDGDRPLLEAIPYIEKELVSPFVPTHCGITVCENIDVILNYNNHWPLRTEKKIHYRVVNICEDDGGHPTVSHDQISLQHRALNNAFKRYNITWELTVHQVFNSSLRQRIILSNCEKSKIGNDHCDTECDHPLTGYDGGDCRYHNRCYPWKRQDGICNMECNNILNEFDDGDCCDPEVTDVTKTCFDPESIYRAYMSVKELKEILQLSGSDFLNVYFARNSVREELAGAATWPWAKEALSHLGGMVLNPSYFGIVGHTHTMIHELGHILGLYHVFKGVSERDSCDDPCREMVPSLETGDFCADTAPTPKSKVCRDPDPVNDTCGLIQYEGTPFNNYMSYTDDDCTNSFTPNQVARMHCYVDLVYQMWVHNKKPTPVPIAPLVIGQTEESVSIYWLPSVSGTSYEREVGSLCEQCNENGAFLQYAYYATSPRKCDSSGYWTPEEAIGSPDVDQSCEPSLQAWSPELHLYDTNMTVPCPQLHGCSLELYFLHPVVGETLTVWTTYISAESSNAISNIEVLTEHGDSFQMGPFHTFCDVPLTIRLNTNKKVKGVKIFTFDEKMEIDAALLTSRENDPMCSGCRPLQYRVLRDPPFLKGPVVQQERKFTDKEVTLGRRYSYRIIVESEEEHSEISPALLHIHGAPYCGDGQVQQIYGEECDDNNLLDGDGCSKQCKKEEGFSCDGEPSRCYVFDGDGMCEPFEKGTTGKDCGFFTPHGFIDQWAAEAYASHQDNLKCPVTAVTGEPSLSQTCKSKFLEINSGMSQYAWFPCTVSEDGYFDQEEIVWLKVCFSRPAVATSIIVYLASDGLMLGDQSRKTVSIQIGDTQGENHTLGSYELSCHQNPLIVNVTHNLILPFFQTASVLLKFSSPLVAVSAVALRTSSQFSALTMNGCMHRSCSTEKCSPIELKHASVNCTSEKESHLKCSVTCHPGFKLEVVGKKHVHPKKRDITIECAYGTWNQAVTCSPIDCGHPDVSHVYYASFSCPGGTTFGKRCFFTCNSPAKLQGGRNWLDCLEDGLWSFPEAYCKLECTLPPLVPNAKLMVPRCQQEGHSVGSICRYKCNPGYYVTGTHNKTPRKKFLKIECLEGGYWEKGGCSPVLCPPPPPVFEGMYTCTNGLEFNSQCTLECPDSDERYTILCSKEGAWTEEFKLCTTLQGSCLPPTNINLLEYNCEEGYHVGAVCYPSCVIALNDPVVLLHNFTADTIKHWMEPIKTESIVCTGKMRWYPDPHVIHCIQSCEPFQGDGWCDTINNRAYCQYDGGDCCPSTLSSRKVITFGAACDQDECTCRDPKAEENQQREKLRIENP
ncbi:pappalysin-2 isoform X2 [Polypterus senegalus]|uniref:pappalysin-2 isoform X2 n=1 Tax=Polypterus senegalus TaxID=55291 RepID=UPI001964A9DF|nr:pappalysin-2 isoform X2 [Polypterus senegalus]